MRLADRKRVKYKPKEHQKIFFKKGGRVQKEVTREAAYAVRVRVRHETGWGPWRWYHEGIAVPSYRDHWFERTLMPSSRARSIVEEVNAFGGTLNLGQQAKRILVWREVKNG